MDQILQQQKRDGEKPCKHQRLLARISLVVGIFFIILTILFFITFMLAFFKIHSGIDEIYSKEELRIFVEKKAEMDDLVKAADACFKEKSKKMTLLQIKIVKKYSDEMLKQFENKLKGLIVKYDQELPKVNDQETLLKAFHEVTEKMSVEDVSFLR